MPDTVIAALISSATTFIATIIGVLVVLWQLRSSASSIKKQIRDEKRIELKLQIYESLCGKFESSTVALAKLTGFVRSSRSSIEVAIDLSQHGIDPTPPRQCFPEFLPLSETYSSSVLELHAELERWEIIHPGVKVLRMGIHAALRGFQVRSSRPYFMASIEVLPREWPEDGEPPWRIPDGGSLDAFNRANEALCADLYSMQSFLHDISIELQNLLVGELFPNRVPTREPLDPAEIVLSLSKADEIEARLREETEWGREMDRIEMEARARFAAAAEAEN